MDWKKNQILKSIESIATVRLHKTDTSTSTYIAPTSLQDCPSIDIFAILQASLFCRWIISKIAHITQSLATLWTRFRLEDSAITGRANIEHGLHNTGLCIKSKIFIESRTYIWDRTYIEWYNVHISQLKIYLF